MLLVAFGTLLAAVLALGLLDSSWVMAMTGLNDFSLHVLAFFALAALGGVAFAPLPLIVGLITVAGGIELGQALVPWHEASLLDWVAGWLGTLIGAGLSLALGRLLGGSRTRSP